MKLQGMAPKVSIICLCYNHGAYVEEALDSVLNQSYNNLELIIVDDASTDGSVSIINRWLMKHPEVKVLALKQNVGNCRAFNLGLALATGKFIIDFSTDDIMELDRIEKQVNYFETLDPSYGVVFTDATYIDANGIVLRDHYSYLFKKGLLQFVPTGDVYKNVLTTFFISSPTMMIRREVMIELNGYDESLAYEDFDFWVRSSRIYKYGFLSNKLTRVRKLKSSMSTGWYKAGDKQLFSTYLVCKKAKSLNHSLDEDKALAFRVKYELKQSVFSNNFEEAKLFYGLLTEMKRVSNLDKFYYFLNYLRLPLYFIRNLYHRLKY